MKKKKRYLGLLIPSIILNTIGLVGVGFGSALIGSTQTEQGVESLAEAFGMIFVLIIALGLGIACLIIGIICILVGTPLLFGGIALKKKDESGIVESKEKKK